MFALGVHMNIDNLSSFYSRWKTDNKGEVPYYTPAFSVHLSNWTRLSTSVAQPCQRRPGLPV